MVEYPKLQDIFPRASQVHVIDGGKGAALAEHTAGLILDSPDDVIDTKPGVVTDVLTAFARAGAEIIQPTTFTQNSVTHSRETNPDGLRTRNQLALHTAWTAARPYNVRVGASIGPLGAELYSGSVPATILIDISEREKRKFIAGIPSSLSYNQAVDAYHRQMTWLTDVKPDGRPDLFMVETLANPVSLAAALEALRRTNADMGTRIPMTLTCTYNHNITGDSFRTSHGFSPEHHVRFANDNRREIIGVGANCGKDGWERAGLLTRLFKVQGPRMPIIMKLNADQPKPGESSQDFLKRAAGYARKVVDEGATVVGGCCGTTPDMIRAMKTALS